MEIETKVQAYRVEKKCPSCQVGFMVSTGAGVTKWKTDFEHKCDSCGNITYYEDVCYPHIIYK